MLRSFWKITLTSWYGNASRVIGPLRPESTIRLTKGQYYGVLMILLFNVRSHKLLHKQSSACVLRCYHAHITTVTHIHRNMFRAIVYISLEYFRLCRKPCVGSRTCDMIIAESWLSVYSLSQEYTWWNHQTETFSALLAICAGNSPVTGEFPT